MTAGAARRCSRGCASSPFALGGTGRDGAAYIRCARHHCAGGGGGGGGCEGGGGGGGCGCDEGGGGGGEGGGGASIE